METNNDTEIATEIEAIVTNPLVKKATEAVVAALAGYAAVEVAKFIVKKVKTKLVTRRRTAIIETTATET